MEYLLAAKQVRKMEILDNSITHLLDYSNIPLKIYIIINAYN